MEEVLNFMSTELEKIGVPYEFLEWTQTVTYRKNYMRQKKNVD